VDYVYRFEHEKDEAKKKPNSKSEALEMLGEWLWQSPDRTGTLNHRSDAISPTVGGNWQLYHCVLQANMLFFFREPFSGTAAKPDGVVFLKGAEIVRATHGSSGTPCVKITEIFCGNELVHFLAQSGQEDLSAWTSALLVASTTDSSAVAVTKGLLISFFSKYLCNLLTFFFFFFFSSDSDSAAQERGLRDADFSRRSAHNLSQFFQIGRRRLRDRVEGI
jgi:hypothetical protein